MTWGGQSVKSGMSGISTGGRLSTVTLSRSSKTSRVQPGSEYSITKTVQLQSQASSGLCLLFVFIIDYRPEEEEENIGLIFWSLAHALKSGLGTMLVFLIVHRNERLEVYCEQKLKNINGISLGRIYSAINALLCY